MPRLSLVGDPQQELQVGTADVWSHDLDQLPPPGILQHKCCANLHFQDLERFRHLVTLQVCQCVNLILEKKTEVCVFFLRGRFKKASLLSLKHFKVMEELR